MEQLLDRVFSSARGGLEAPLAAEDPASRFGGSVPPSSDLARSPSIGPVA